LTPEPKNLDAKAGAGVRNVSPGFAALVEGMISLYKDPTCKLLGFLSVRVAATRDIPPEIC